MNYPGNYQAPAGPPANSTANMNYPDYQTMNRSSPGSSYANNYQHPPQMDQHSLPNNRGVPNYPDNRLPQQNYNSHLPPQQDYRYQNQPQYNSPNNVPSGQIRQPGYSPAMTSQPSNYPSSSHPSYPSPINSNYGSPPQTHQNNYSNTQYNQNPYNAPPRNQYENYPTNTYTPPPRNQYHPSQYQSNPHTPSPPKIENGYKNEPYSPNSYPTPPTTENKNVPYNTASYTPPPQQKDYKGEEYSPHISMPNSTSMPNNKRSHPKEGYNQKNTKAESSEISNSEPSKKMKHENISTEASSVKLPSSGEDTLPLNNGKRIPIIQFGTYKMKGPDSKVATLSALRAGYKGLDTASVYDNEKEVGEAIMESGIPRENLFIQTKLWRSFCGRGKNGKPKCDTELNKSLKKLGTKYIDCWLMHWPGPGRHLNYPPVRQGMDRPKVKIEGNATKMVPEDWTPAMRLDTYKEMAKHVGSTVKSLGMCNLSVRQLEELLIFCKGSNIPKPAVIQNECHPLLIASEVRKLCADEGIVFQAYASLGAGSLGLLEHPVVTEVAKNNGVTTAQVLLRWGIQLGCVLLPKSQNPERQKKNLDVWSFKLSDEDMMKLSSCDKSVQGQNTMAGWLREHDPDFY